MNIGQDGWLSQSASGLPALTRVPSVRTTNLEEPKPLGICWHWTAGPALGPAYATALAESIRNYDKVKDTAASWHVLVAKNGRVIQSVPFNKGSWHVGRPGRIGGLPVKSGDSWDATGWPDGRLYANVNRVLVGVELENSGLLRQIEDKFYCWPYFLDPRDPASGPDPKWCIPSDRAKLHGDEWYDDFPSAQLDAATRLLQALSVTYKWKRAVSQYQHRHFDPSRKLDPGPLFSDEYLPTILDTVFGPELVPAAPVEVESPLPPAPEEP
jgi:hypothetical protein